MKNNTSTKFIEVKKYGNFLSRLFLSIAVLSLAGVTNAQTGTWTKVVTNAPHQNAGVMLQLTDGTVICKNVNGVGQGTGWDKLTPSATGSYVNGTWTSIASMANDRLFFPSQVMANGQVFVAGGEYGAGATHGEFYNPVTNTWTATGAVPSNQNVYDGNSEILPNGTVLVGIQNGLNPSFNIATYSIATNTWTAQANSPLNHDEAAWLKLPDSSVLFVGIGGTSSCRYRPQTNTWVADGTVPVQLYDPFGSEAGAAFMLPNGKAIFLGATGLNAFYTPSGNATPGVWTTAAPFPKLGGIQLGTPDAPACMMPNGRILCSVSFIGESGNEFRVPTYFYEYDYTTNAFTQVTAAIPGQGGADSLKGVASYQTNLLQLADGNVLMGIDQQGALSSQYFVYTPATAQIAQGKPVVNSIYQTACGNTFSIRGKVFNGISEGAAYGDDWANSTNYPLVRLVSGPNVYYCKTTNWNRIGAVQTDSLEDTCQFTLPVGLPPGCYSLYVVANGFPSSPFPFCTYGVTAVVNTNVLCRGSSTGSITATATGGNLPYTYNWTPSGGTNATATGLSAGTYTITVKDALGCTVTASATITQPAVALNVTTSTTPAGCGSSNGSATANATGGTGAYTYSWAPVGGTNATATGLSASSYTVTVKDANGCTFTAVANVTNSGGETVSINTITNVTCNGASTGKITTNTVGGTLPYTYAWTPVGGTNATASNLSAATYTVTVHDANGCISTASATITQPAALTVLTSTTPASCASSNGTATATPSGGTGAYTYSWAPVGGTNATATGLSAATYTVTVKDANGCTTTASATVINSGGGETVSINTITHVTCNGLSNGQITTNTVGGTPPYTYAWTPVGGTNSSATGLSAATYTVTVHDANGCVSTASATVTQPAALTVLTSTTPASCASSNGTATATPSGGTGAYTYSWAPVGGTNATATGLSAATYTVTVKDANGCTTTASATVTTSGGGETVSINTITNVTCNGASTGQITTNTVGGTPPYTYAWTPVGGTNSSATGLSAATYTVTVHDANGCVSTASATITQPAALTVLTSTTPATCGGSNGTATATPSGGAGAYTYSWAPVGGTNATATGLSAATYTVTVKDANGCTTTATAVVGNAGGETVSINTITNILCNGASTGKITTNTVGGTLPYTYAWAPSGGTNSTASNLSAGTYTVTAHDANGCVSTASATVTQPPLLTVSTSTTPATCGNNNGTATATAGGGTGAYTYAWTPVGGTSATATGLSAGTYTITLKDANGCTVTATANVGNITGETVTIPIFSNITCAGGNNGSATASAAGGTSPYTYNWTPSGGTNATASNLTAGTYTITVTDANACVATASITLTQPPAMTVVPLNPTICSGGSVTLTASGATSYSWSPATGLSATNIANPVASPTVTTSYTVTGTTGGCVQTLTVVVTVNPTPVISVIPPNASICSGDSVVLTASGAISYTWAPPAGLSATNTVVVTAFPAATTTYTVTGTSNGCTGTRNVTVTVNPTPTVTVLPASATICSGNSVTLTASGATSYSWTPAAGLSNANIANPIASPAVTTSYTVTGTTGSCSNTAVVIVTVNPTPTVTLTPTSATICSGGGGTSVTASGATTYSWAPAAGLSATVGATVNANPAVTTTYTVTGTIGTCTGTQMITITVNPTPTVSVIPANPGICSGSSVGLTASGATTYSWSPATGLSATNIANPVASPTVTTSYTVTGTTGGCTSTAVVTVNVTPAPMTTVNPTASTICSGNSLVLTASGGASTYTWAPPAGLSATTGSSVTATPAVTTTYTVVGTNGGCSDSAMVTITVNPSPTLTVVPASPITICRKDSVLLTASGATTYSWSPATGLSATNIANPMAKPLVTTTYTVTGTTGTCTATQTVTVIVSPIPSVHITPANATICTGGPGVNLTGSGAVSYTWAPAAGLSATVGTNVNANPTVTTTYTVVGVSKTGCSNTDSITITVDSGVVASISGMDTICRGDSTTLTVTASPSGSSYSWSNGATTASITVKPNSTTTYSVTVTKAICTATVTNTVVVNIPPTPIISQSGDTLKCTPAGLTYQWYKNGSPLVGSTFDTAIVHTSGSYKVQITTAQGCSDSSTYTVKSLLGMNEVSYEDYIHVYPNPTSGDLKVDCNIPEGDYKLSLTDVLGQTLYTNQVEINGHYTGNINMYGYAPGMYILTIKGPNSITEKKILLSK